MLERTETLWKDSGYDCDHCGGRIYLRHDLEKDATVLKCYQCRKCGCQWSLDGEIIRIGNDQRCIDANKEQPGALIQAFINDWRVQVLLLFVLALVLIRFGGSVAIRYLLPLALVAIAIYAVFKYLQSRRNP